MATLAFCLLSSNIHWNSVNIPHNILCMQAGYRSGALTVLAATSTLAAGINLPAKRVILRSLWQVRATTAAAGTSMRSSPWQLGASDTLK